jgi:hypothetical protein
MLVCVSVGMHVCVFYIQRQKYAHTYTDTYIHTALHLPFIEIVHQCT